MLVSIHRQLRRHRRKVVLALAIVAVAATAVTAHAALMNPDHGASSAALVCLAVGGCVVLTVVAAVALRRRPARDWALVSLMPAPALPSLPADTGVIARGSPPPLLQVFRF